jgi:DNA polymerase-4
VRDQATILHADLDAFFASVEQRDDPRLRGRPVIVGGGVVQAASYEARASGVHSAMGGGQARRLCPDAIVVQPRWQAYVEASRAVFRLFREAAPVVEGLSIDEAFLDVGGLEHIRGSPRQIAARLRRDVAAQVGLPLSVGVARTKFLAKVASAVAKPDGLRVVEPGEELRFLYPLDVERIWGVGPKTAKKLRRRGITTVGQAAAIPEPELVAMLGRAQGRKIHALAHNRDPRPVRARRRRGSFGAQSAFRSPGPPGTLDAALNGLVDRVTRRMRAAGATGRTVTLRLRFSDYARATRSYTLATATVSSETILAVLRFLAGSAMPLIRRQGLTLIGIAVSGLDCGDGSVQLELPVDGASRRRALDLALDDIRTRFGPAAVTRASLLGRDPGLAAWLMPGEGERARTRARRAGSGRSPARPPRPRAPTRPSRR